MSSCVRRKLVQQLLITCFCHLAIAILFIHSLNKYIESAHTCQALSQVQGYSSKLIKVLVLMEPEIYRAFSNVTLSVRPSLVTPHRTGPSFHNFYSMQCLMNVSQMILRAQSIIHKHLFSIFYVQGPNWYLSYINENHGVLNIGLITS